MRQITLTLVVLILLNGCSVINSSEDSFKLKYIQSTDVTDFNLLTKDLIKDLSATILDIKKNKRQISPLYVTDFVNINDLDNKSQLGFILSDDLKTTVTQNLNWPIYQIEFAKYLKIGENGAKLLSRNVSELKYRNLDTHTYGLIGTYAITQRQLIIYLKFVNLKNGIILKASTKRIELTDEIKHLEERKDVITPQIYQPVVL